MEKTRTPYYDDLPYDARMLFNSLCALAVLHDDHDLIKKLQEMTLDYRDSKSPIEVLYRCAFDLYVILLKKDIKLIPQYEVYKDDNTKYILDFAFIGKNLKLAVECDGHEFHERTKDQVNYGNKRNYDLQMQGFEVLHYSGSEIHSDVLECVKKTVAYIERKEGKADGDIQKHPYVVLD